MEREIKFRAWDKKIEKMFYDVEWRVYPEAVLPSPRMQIWVGGRSNWRSNIHRHEIVLMQYIGLKDMYGKEIYEGDIIKQGDDPECWFSPRVVEFKDGSWTGRGIRIYVDQDKAQYEGHVSQNEWEVIGNIYESPEKADSCL